MHSSANKDSYSCCSHLKMDTMFTSDCAPPAVSTSTLSSTFLRCTHQGLRGITYSSSFSQNSFIHSKKTKSMTLIATITTIKIKNINNYYVISFFKWKYRIQFMYFHKNHGINKHSTEKRDYLG